MKNALLTLQFFFCLPIFSQLAEKYVLKYKISQDSVFYHFIKKPEDLDSVLSGDKIIDEEMSWAVKATYQQFAMERFLILSPKDTLFEVFSTIKNDSIDYPVMSTVSRFYIDSFGNNYSMYLGDDINEFCGYVFKLPDQPVAIGDVWKTNVDNIEFNGYVVPDTFHLTDEVRLMNVVSIDNQLIAEIVYNYNFYCYGDFYGKKMEWKISFKGQASFNISKGYWIEYNCIYSGTVSNQLPSFNIIYKLELMNEMPSNLFDPEKYKNKSK